MSINRLKLTGAAILVIRASTSQRRPRQLSRAFADPNHNEPQFATSSGSTKRSSWRDINR